MMYVFKTITRHTLFLAVVFLLAPIVHAASPGVGVLGLIHSPSGDIVGRNHYSSLQGLGQLLNQRSIPFHLSGGSPQYFLGQSAQSLSAKIEGFLQQSSSPANMVWWAGHGTVVGSGGFDNSPVSRTGMLQGIRDLANKYQKDVVFLDHSCGSGQCHAAGVPVGSDHLKGVITSTGEGQTGYTGVLENFFGSVSDNFSQIDRGFNGIGAGDGALSLGEVKQYAEQYNAQRKTNIQVSGDPNYKMMYGKDASPDKNPELAENVCEVLPPALDGPGVTDELAEQMSLLGYNDTVDEQIAKYPSSSGKKIYFFVPDAKNIRRFLAGLTSGKATYDINGLPIAAGSYGIGKTSLLGQSSGTNVTAAYFKSVGEDACVAEPVKFVPPSPNTPGANDGLSGGGGLGGNGLLPLLMQSLLGGGFGGAQGGYGNNQYANPYGQYTQQDCTLQPISPLCGVDGKTYKNTCYLSSSRAQLKSRGACEQATPSPTPNPNVTGLTNQINESGIPNSMLESVRNVVFSILSQVLSGGIRVQETIVK